MTTLELQKMANEVRKGIVTAVHSAKAGHPGGSLSAADVFTYLYFEEMNIDPKDPKNPDRDRFVLSKGHTAPGYYSAMAHRGYFPVEELVTLRHLGSHLQGHPCMQHVPGIDMSSGSLGQGISAAVGMALAGKMDKKDYRVYTLLGDGEIQEGQVWEAAMSAAKFKLNRLIGILDHNKVQMSGTNDELMPLGDIRAKWEAFGWHTLVIDGHNMGQIMEALDKANENVGAPLMIIMETVKGKGVSFMEGKAAWHGACPNEEQYRQALAELGEVCE